MPSQQHPHPSLPLPSFTPSTPIRPAPHLPTHPLTAHPYTPPTSSHSYHLPPYSASSLPSLASLSSLPPLPPSVLPTPAKAQLNSYLVELVKNSIRITDDFSAMCKAKVREKDQHIAQLIDEIERLRAASRVTQAHAQLHEQERAQPPPPSSAEASRAKAPDDGMGAGRGSLWGGMRGAAEGSAELQTETQLQAVLTAKDERIRLLQAQLTALRLSVQSVQHGAEVRERQLTAAQRRAERSAQLHRNAHVATWLLLLTLLLLLLAAALHFRDTLVPAVCDFAYPYLEPRTQTDLKASRVVREQCELEKDQLQLEWQHSAPQCDQYDHHHDHQHDHGHTHVEEVQYKVVQCPPPVVCPACPSLSCPPSLPPSELEYGGAFSLNPADADASFLASLSKGELVMQLLREKLKVESGSQWEMTHRISKTQWDTERRQLQSTIQELQLKAEQQPAEAPQSAAASSEAASCSAALSNYEAQVATEKKTREAAVESLTLLTAEHQREKELRTACDAEKQTAEERLHSAVREAVAAEQASMKERQLRCDETAGWLETARADSERLQVELHNAQLAVDNATAELALAKAVTAAAALQLPPVAAVVVKDEHPQPSNPVASEAAAAVDPAACARDKEDVSALSLSLSAVQRELEEQRLQCREVELRGNAATDSLAKMRAELVELQSTHSALQGAYAVLSLPKSTTELAAERQPSAVNDSQPSVSVEDLRQREEQLLSARIEAEQLKQRVVDLEAVQRTVDALQQSVDACTAQLAGADLELSSARQAAEDRQSELTSSASRLSSLTREHALSQLVIDELQAELRSMQSHYDQQLASLNAQVTADVEREREAERSRLTLAELHEQVKDAEQRAAEVGLLLSSIASDLAQGGAVSVQLDASGAVVTADVSAQLDLVEARINVSRLVNEKRELSTQLAALQAQMSSLSSSAQSASTSAASDSASPVASEAQLQRLRAETESAERRAMDCEGQLQRLQAEVGRREGGEGARSSFSSLGSTTYLPFLPGVPLPSFLSSFPSWSPALKLLFLFSLITADLLLFQLSMPSRHRAFTAGMAVLYTALSALCVHYAQFFLALFLAANAVMALWMAVNPSAALIACQWTCCGRPLGKKAATSASTAMVLANGKSAHSSPPLLPPAPLPALAPPAGPPPPPMNGGGGGVLTPPMKIMAGQRSSLPPPQRPGMVSFSPSQSPQPSPGLPSRPLPSSFQVPPLPRPSSDPSSFPPPSPPRGVLAPQARRSSVSSVLSDDGGRAARASAEQPSSNPPPGRPAFHRLPTSARMDVMEERQQSHPEWGVAAPDISRAQTISSRLDISSSPAGGTGGGAGDYGDGQPGGSTSMDAGGAPDLTAFSVTPPPQESTPINGRGARMSLDDAGAPPAPAAAEGEGKLGDVQLVSPSSRVSSASSSSDRSFPSFSPPLQSQQQPLSQSPLTLQSMTPAPFSGYSSHPSTPLHSYSSSSSFQQTESESASAYPSELSPAYPSSLSSSASSSAQPSRRGSLSASGGALPQMPHMPQMPSMPMPGAGGGGVSGPMPPRPGMAMSGMGGASGSYGRRPPPTDDDFA